MLTHIVTGIKIHTRKSGGIFNSEGILFFDTGIKNHTHVTKRRGQETEMQTH